MASGRNHGRAVMLYEMSFPEDSIRGSKPSDEEKRARRVDRYDAFRLAGNKATVILADQLKDVGLQVCYSKWVSRSAIQDMADPATKERMLEEGAQARCKKSKINTPKG